MLTQQISHQIQIKFASLIIIISIKTKAFVRSVTAQAGLNGGNSVEIKTRKYCLGLILQFINLMALLMPLMLAINITYLHQLRVLVVGMLHQTVLVLLDLPHILFKF